MNRRAWGGVLLVSAVATVAGLGWHRRGATGRPDRVWGRRGVRAGEFNRPRAATIDGKDRLWVVDFTARVQAFDLDGNFFDFSWTTPDYRNGRPSGLGTDNQGRLLVADSHYHTLRTYAPDGTELGHADGGFGYLSDCVQDASGFYYVSEFGEQDRITKLNPDGQVLSRWGGPGAGPGQFNRVRALAIGPDGLLYAVDACNHRVQVFTKDGQFVRSFGTPGSEPGEFRYPYDLSFGPSGELYVVERANHRVQKLTSMGEPLAMWGSSGSGPGQLADPWAVVCDRFGRVHVIDTENHRVQRVRF